MCSRLFTPRSTAPHTPPRRGKGSATGTRRHTLADRSRSLSHYTALHVAAHARVFTQRGRGATPAGNVLHTDVRTRRWSTMPGAWRGPRGLQSARVLRRARFHRRTPTEERVVTPAFFKSKGVASHPIDCGTLAVTSHSALDQGSLNSLPSTFGVTVVILSEVNPLQLSPKIPALTRVERRKG